MPARFKIGDIVEFEFKGNGVRDGYLVGKVTKIKQQVDFEHCLKTWLYTIETKRSKNKHEVFEQDLNLVINQ
jgi:cell shape-determining protein MreC